MRLVLAKPGPRHLNPLLLLVGSSTLILFLFLVGSSPRGLQAEEIPPAKGKIWIRPSCSSNCVNARREPSGDTSQP